MEGTDGPVDPAIPGTSPPDVAVEESGPVIIPNRIGSLSVAALRRASPHLHSPTRTLRLTEVEHSTREAQRDGTPTFRPRSNPRSRTPRANESPLDPDEFRRRQRSEWENLGGEANEQQRQGGTTETRMEGARALENVTATASTPTPRRITIRPLAGSAVGTVVSNRIIEERRYGESSSSLPKSRKQGPSHRKIRRWNNDHFPSLAAEIASNSRNGKGRVCAETLAKAAVEAHLYRNIYNPADHKPSKAMAEFLRTDNMKGVRDRFFEGELPVPSTVNNRCNNNMSSRRPLSLDDCLNRIESRLRRVVVKACTNSYPACLLVDRMESFVVRAFSGKSAVWGVEEGEAAAANGEDKFDVFLEAPTVTDRINSDTKTACFYFDNDSSVSGFHRLLLVAICQFHGLTAVSKTVEIQIGQHSVARGLTVSGVIDATSSKFKLLDAVDLKNGKESNVVDVQVNSIVEQTNKVALHA